MKHFYTYYSYEQWGRGYIGKRECECLPEKDLKYMGSFKDKTFKPHKHIWKEQKRNVIAQESWVVLQGSVKCIFYDLDNTILSTEFLYPGDASFTLEGGHNYEILEDNTLVYEYKTGPYEGQELDKIFI
jgi:hypothetical protein